MKTAGHEQPVIPNLQKIRDSNCNFHGNLPISESIISSQH